MKSTPLNNNQKNDFGLVFWVHLILLILIIASPFLFSLAVIIITIALFWIQFFIFGGCVLTFKQFGKTDPEMTFWYYLFTLLKLDVNKKKVKIAVRYILPFIIVVMTILWQSILGHDYLLF